MQCWIEEDEEIILLANNFTSSGFKAKDSLHVACAVKCKCQYFITTDTKMLNKRTDLIKIVNPLTFISILEEDFDED